MYSTQNFLLLYIISGKRGKPKGKHIPPIPGMTASSLFTQNPTVISILYGNRAYDDTFAEPQDTLEAAVSSYTAAVSAVAEHSILRQYAAGHPDAEDRKELAAFAVAIRSKKIPLQARIPSPFLGTAPTRNTVMPHEAPCWQILRPLRPLCDKMSRSHYPCPGAFGNRYRKVHLLHALHCPVPPESPQRQPCPPCKSLQRTEGERTLSINPVNQLRKSILL